MAGLRDLCLPAAGSGLKMRYLVPSWPGSSVVVVGATRVVLTGVFVWTIAVKVKAQYDTQNNESTSKIFFL